MPDDRRSSVAPDVRLGSSLDVPEAEDDSHDLTNRERGPRRPPRPERRAPTDATSGPVIAEPAPSLLRRRNGRGAVTEAQDAPEFDHTTESPVVPNGKPPVVAVPAPRHELEEAPVEPSRASERADEGRRPVRRGRRVRRIVRRIDLWSVLKLSLVVYTCLYAAVLATLAALWGFAYSSGSIDKLESFLGDVGLENFHFYGDRMFRAVAAIGAVAVIAGTVVTVLATALVNVISEMTGGIRLVVIEEER